MEKTVKVLAIVPYRLDFCAGQRFRIELWAKRLAARGIEIEFLPFAGENLTDIIYRPERKIKKGSLMISDFLKQLAAVFRADKPDIVFIYREAALIGPAIIEKLIRRRWQVPIIYDIDEPYFVPYVSPANGSFNRLRFFSKFNRLLEMSDCVFAVNEAIGNYAGKFNENVEIVPMAIDIERYRPSVKPKTGKPKVAWVGTWSNQPNIAPAIAPMRKLKKEFDFTFRIIADDAMAFEGVEVDFVPWAFDVEIEKLQESDIGIVPVQESAWSRWKFFFKTIQFMGLGMPVVATATGSNLEIIKDGVNGFLVETEKDWYDKLKLLIENPAIREQMGGEARRTAVENFDIEKQFDFLERKIKKMCRRAEA